MEWLRALDGELRHLERASAVLNWDMETFMPPAGVEERAEQLALLQGIAHERLTVPETGRRLEALGSTADNPRGDETLPDLDRDFLRVVRREYDRAVRLPREFVSEAARAEGLSQAAWKQARAGNDFAAFLPHLREMIGNARKRSEFWGFGGARGSLYDGLLDIYEPGMGEGEIGALFAVLRERLSAQLKEIGGRGKPPAVLDGKSFPVERQKEFCRWLLEHIGFDTRRGRMDASAHPFATTLGADDVRITTRYFADNLLSGIFSVIHESGHAMYDMGFPAELRGSCLASGASMAIHESQSRLWENVVGRSAPFLGGLLPKLREVFPEQLAGVGADDFFRAVNEVRPSLIRVEADEVSYGLHVILRFEIERELISGRLDPERLPQVWREKTREFFGIDVDPAGPRSDADGVLQDVHWSFGAFGYFPSYVLGNLYALHFFGKIRRDVPDFDGRIAAGDFVPLREWLCDNVYAWGCRLEPARLLEKVTGERLGAEPFLRYIDEKYLGNR